MSQGQQSPQQTVIVQQTAGTSGVGLAGLVFSVLGWFTCGLLCIPGAALSFLGLFARGPKGAAIAGLIVGFPGVVFFVVVGMGIIAGVLGIGGAAISTAQQAADRARMEAEQRENHDAVQVPAVEFEEVDQPTTEMDTAPPVVEGEAAAVEQEPAAMPAEVEKSQPDAAEKPDSFRMWTSADGKFSVEADYVEAFFGTVTLRKRDGSTLQVDVAKLSDPDQAYIKDRKGY